MNKTLLTTTLANLREAGACYGGYNKVVRHLQGRPFTEADAERETYIRFAHKEPINLLTILDSNGVYDMLWALRATREDCDVVARLMAADFAEAVLPIFEKHYPDDDRPHKAIEAARGFALGVVTTEERDAAWDAAWDAARAAAGDAAWDAAWAAARAAAWDAARAAARAAAWDAARAAQAEIIRKYLAEPQK